MMFLRGCEMGKKEDEQKTEKSKRGRKKREIDLKLVINLAGIMCTIEEVAAVLEVPVSTLKNRSDVMEVFHRGLDMGRMSLRRKQFKMADKSASMLIWLGKQYLGQKDVQQLEVTDMTINWEEVKNYHKKKMEEEKEEF